jgi:hypothetical protein
MNVARERAVPRRVDSDQDAFDLIEAHLIIPPIIEPIGPDRLVIGHLLCDLELAAIPQVLGYASCP